jgi:hypothetical protein
MSLVRRVLARLLEHDLYVKAEKCVFSQQAVTFLGYCISTSGLVMECDHIAAVVNWPSPTTVKEVQWFLGFANYYRGFGQVAAPITSLLKCLGVEISPPCAMFTSLCVATSFGCIFTHVVVELGLLISYCTTGTSLLSCS